MPNVDLLSAFNEEGIHKASVFAVSCEGLVYFMNLLGQASGNVKYCRIIFDKYKFMTLSYIFFSVLHDIISTMFHKRFMEELFKPQPLYSKKAMRTVFDRLAHASIMRLNAPSMDKVIFFNVNYRLRFEHFWQLVHNI